MQLLVHTTTTVWPLLSSLSPLSIHFSLSPHPPASVLLIWLAVSSISTAVTLLAFSSSHADSKRLSVSIVLERDCSPPPLAAFFFSLSLHLPSLAVPGLLQLILHHLAVQTRLPFCSPLSLSPNFLLFVPSQPPPSYLITFFSYLSSTPYFILSICTETLGSLTTSTMSSCAKVSKWQLGWDGMGQAHQMLLGFKLY